MRMQGNLTYLVDHHDRQEVTEGSEEQAIQIMLDLVTDGVAESIKKNLANDENNKSKGNMTQRPAVLECIQNKQKLHNQVYRYANCVQDVEDHKQADGIGGA